MRTRIFCHSGDGTLIDRRALAGGVIGMAIFILHLLYSDAFFFTQASKIIGATSEADLSFDTVPNPGQAVIGVIVSIAPTLDHFHVPGHSEYSVGPSDTVEIRLDLHGEPVSSYDAVLS